jgi:hypothetical protein
VWQFSEQTVLYVNGRFDVRELIDRMLGLGLPSVTRPDLQRYFDPSMGPVQSRGIMLPAPLCDCTVRCLTEMNVTVLPHTKPTPRKLTAFVMNGDDFIVAEDFLLELPEFEHRPEWFVPFAPDPARSRHG